MSGWVSGLLIVAVLLTLITALVAVWLLIRNGTGKDADLVRQVAGLRQQLQRASPDNDGAPALQVFALALAVALIASQALAFGGQIDLNTAQVVRANFSGKQFYLSG